MTKYKVVASTGYKEHAAGDEFEADLSEDEERRALERGSLEVVGGKKQAKDDKGEESDA